MRKKRRSEKKEYISGTDIIQMAQQNVRNIQKRVRASSNDIFTRGMRQMRQLDYQPKVKVYGEGITFETYKRSREIIKQMEQAKTRSEVYKLMQKFFQTVGGVQNIVIPQRRVIPAESWVMFRSVPALKKMFGGTYHSLYYMKPTTKPGVYHQVALYISEKGIVKEPRVYEPPKTTAGKFVAEALRQIPIKIKTTPGSQGYMQWRNPKTGMWEKIDIATRTVIAKSPTKFAGVEVWKGKR